MSVSFDDFREEGYADLKDQKPFFTVDQKDEKKLLEWLKNDYSNKRYVAKGRVNEYRKHLALFKGIHYKAQTTRDTVNEDKSARNSTVRNPRIVVNFIQEMTETRISDMSDQKPSVNINPASNEWDDKINSESVDKMVKTLWYEQSFEDILSGADKMAFIGGTAWVFTEWDKNAGYLHPYYQEAKDEGKPVMISMDAGETEVEAEEPISVGDVAYYVKGVDECFPQMGKRNFRELEHVTTVEWKHIDELKKLYPKVDIKDDDNDETCYDYADHVEKKIKGMIGVKKFYHRKSEFSDPVIVEFTSSVILDIKPGYKHGRLPCRIITDVDVPNELHGRSFIHNISRLNNLYNSNESAIARNFAVASAPKWMVPAGSTSVSSLNNEITVVEYKGQVAPRLENMATTGSEIFKHQETNEQRIRRLSLVQGVARGDIPPGVTAAVALQFLSEKEQKRMSRYVGKRSQLQIDVVKDTIALMGQFYKEDDKRMMKILGEDDASYMEEQFEVSSLETPFDVRVEVSNSLSESKAGRISAISELNATSNTSAEGPIFTRQKTISMLGLGDLQEFMDASTMAIRAAQSENNAILRGKPVQEPKEWEDHINHYLEHVKAIQQRSFKEKSPEAHQMAFALHIKITEMLMWQRARQNPLFRSKVMAIEYFPIFFTIPAEELLAINQMALTQQMGAK